MPKPEPCILVIFGASGDLSYRKLIPAIYALARQQLLPERFTVLGTGRTRLSNDEFRSKSKASILKFAQPVPNNDGDLDRFVSSLNYLSMDTQFPDDYKKLLLELQKLNQEFQTGNNLLFYLAVPPVMYEPIAGSLALVGLNRQSEGYKRIIIEKPFGYDLDSGRKLNDALHDVFDEDQIYRIDHYLGKETVQNILFTRFSNGIFEPLWNRNYIRYIEITSAESIGVENRGGYYDGSGALRDMVQNHLLQMVGLTAMEPPSSFDSNSIRDETLKVFHALRPYKKLDIHKYVLRGQYTAATINGKSVYGYREETGVHPDSETETFVAMKFYIDNWRWGGVPFYIRTGKRLPTRVTEIVVHFKPTPHYLFAKNEVLQAGNQLILRIQPDEGILLKIGMKIPGAGSNVQAVNLDFHYKDLADKHIPEAYERLLHDAMSGDSTLYARGDAVEAAWKFVTPIQNAWKNDDTIKLYGYPAGTWGPLEANDLFVEEEINWRYPCKNLSDDGIYCEL